MPESQRSFPQSVRSVLRGAQIGRTLVVWSLVSVATILLTHGLSSPMSGTHNSTVNVVSSAALPNPYLLPEHALPGETGAIATQHAIEYLPRFAQVLTPVLFAEGYAQKLPDTALITDVPSEIQDRSLNCEFRSAADLAGFYGSRISWQELFEVVGPDASGNPHAGFVGRSIDDPPGSLYPSGYGIYAEPIAQGLRRLGIAAQSHVGQDVEWLKRQIAARHPVVVWATYDMLPQTVVEWRTQDGANVRGVRYEHTFTVVGYDEHGVWVNDPSDAQRKHFSWRVFELAWSLLENMALTVDESPPVTRSP